jgi:zinc transport system permease protein
MMLEMLHYDFMQRAFIAGLITAILASISGSFIVLRRYSLMTETLAHTALVGVAIGLFAGISTLWAAVGVSVLSAWLIEYLRERFGLYSDAILAIFLSGSLALAIIIVSISGAFNNSLFSYLFGSILAVNREDLIIMGVFGTVATVLLLGFSKAFLFIAYDEEVAKTSGIKVRALNYLLVTIVAVIVALSIRIVGTFLIAALMVIPTVAALQFKKSFFQTVILALLFACFSVILGMVFSYIYSLPSGAAIVMCVIVVFVVSLVINKK